MDVILVVLGDVIVEHCLHIIHIDAPGRHIRGHQDLCGSVPEAVHDTVPLLLLQIPVKALGEIAAALEGLHQLIHLLLRITEGHRQLRGIQVQQTAHDLHLIPGLHLVIILGHLGNGQLLFYHPHHHRILLELLCNVCNGLGHGGREHHRLPFLGKSA